MATLAELENALRKADAAGNADDARALAGAIRQMRQSDFSNVEAGVTGTTYENANDSDFARLIAGKRKEPSIADQLGREVGLGARAMLRGAYSLPGIVMDPLAEIERRSGGNFLSKSGEAAERHADILGLPRPETATERVGGDITSALTGGGGTMALGRSLAGRAPGVVQRVGQVFASQPATQTAGLVAGSGAAGTTREAGGSQGAQIAASLIGGLSPAAVKTGTAAALRGAVRGGEAGRGNMERTIQDFAAVGAQPSVGQASGSRVIQAGENLLAGGPTSAGVMGRAAERQAESIGAGLRSAADRFSPSASAERAGRAVERGAEQFTRNTNAMRKALYWQADQFIPETTNVPVSNTWQTLVKLTSPTPGAQATTSAMVNPKIAALRQNIADDLAASQARPTARKALPESGALVTPNTPTPEQMQRLSRVEMVPLAKARSVQREMRFDQFDKGKHPGALIEGYGDIPVAVRRRDGEYLIYDGNHRASQAIAEGKPSLRMRVIDAADYDPEAAGRTPAPDRITDEDLLAELGVSIPNVATRAGATQQAMGLPYSAVKDIRSRIGEALSDYSLTTDKPTAEYKRLYAALSQDMEEAARRQGPAAVQATRRANNYFKTSAERIEQLQRVVEKNGGPERVFQATMSGTQDGGTTLRAVMQSLPKEGQQALTAAVIKRMGLATPGAQDAAGEAFSAQTFLTNWNRVSPEAKRALFDRHGPAFSANMDRIARVASNIKQGSKAFANPSGTANRAAAIGYVLSLAGTAGTGNLPALGGLVAGGVGANVLARGLTNPRFVSWLAKTTEMPASAIPQQLVLLKTQGKDDPEVLEIAEALEQAHREQQQAAGQQ